MNSIKLSVLAIFLGAATPAHAQLAPGVTSGQLSLEVPAGSVEPLFKAKAPEPPPALVKPLIIEKPKPILRQRVADKTFWLHSSAFMGSIALDAWSTSRFVNYNRSHQNLIGTQPGICTEGNRSLGPTPSDAHIAGYFAAWTGGEVAATYLLKRLTRHSKTRWVRESWRFPMTYLTAYHSYWGLHNLAVCK